MYESTSLNELTFWELIALYKSKRALKPITNISKPMVILLGLLVKCEFGEFEMKFSTSSWVHFQKMKIVELVDFVEEPG